MSHKIILALSLVLSGAFCVPASAGWIIISDASQVQYMTDGAGRIYFRNLDQFDSTNALGCCYNYWIDTTTIEGKNIYAMFLSYIPQAKGFRIAVPDGKQPGLLSGAGSW